MNISASIKAKRLECGLTQKELADKVGVDQSMICQIERGTKSPTLALSVEIAAALGCDVCEFTKDIA
ncbi:helix-turn-helix domain-containing protein [Yeguia hominis]|uniref:Helix-turn-helix transcriptional regulator n=1 Tax=Yeguia hominis TaxID=2763662 RepID=A0A926D7N0_9FIRM|nr:helix-turn-helix transcriptional regulator [Yeguia hominis]MBC8533198.1 helix-turn-helix transcriptional regulator [Yeguia hominis]